MPTAILVDGDFFLRRIDKIYGQLTTLEVVDQLKRCAFGHLRQKDGRRRVLYRIFFYDCPPLSKKAHNPLTKRPIDFSRTTLYSRRSELHSELVKVRKLALRLGYLDERNAHWTIRRARLADLFKRRIRFDDLGEDELIYEARQKGVDMRIGLDIASLAYKRLVDQIVLFAGDSDFVPAAKLARREGIDFILDPMWAPIRPDLHEHIDGLRSTCPRPGRPDDRAPADLPELG